eukprot:s1865_g25.t1
MQKQDGSTLLDHSAYCETIETIKFDSKDRRDNDPATPNEHQQLRAVLGAAQWRVYQSAPHHGARLSLLQSQLSNPTVQTLKDTNKLVREIYAHRHVGLRYELLEHSNPEGTVFVAWCDAAVGNRKGHTSSGGYFIAACEPKIFEGNSRAWLNDAKARGQGDLHSKFEDNFQVPKRGQVYADMSNVAWGWGPPLVGFDPARSGFAFAMTFPRLVALVVSITLEAAAMRHGRIQCPGTGGTCHCNCKMAQQMPMAVPMTPMAPVLPPPPPAAPVVPPLPPPAAPLVALPPPPDALPAQPLVQLPPLPEISHLGPEDIPKLTTPPPPPSPMSEDDVKKAMLKWLSPGELDQRQQQLEDLKEMQKSTREEMAKALTAAGTSMADHAMQQQIIKHQMAAAAMAGAPAPAPAPAAKGLDEEPSWKSLSARPWPQRIICEAARSWKKGSSVIVIEAAQVSLNPSSPGWAKLPAGRG